MNTLLQPFKELEEFNLIKKDIENKKLPVHITGCIDSQKTHVVYGLGEYRKNKVIITYNELRAKEIYEDMKFFHKNIYLYPAKDLIFYSADIHNNYIVAQRIEVLKGLIEKEEATIIMTIDGALEHLVTLDTIKESILTFQVGEILNIEKTKEDFVLRGYERVELVETKGQFSIRGGIIDIYPITEENAYRIELWDDEIDSIRTMDIKTQRSIEKIDSIKVYPGTEVVLKENNIKNALIKLEKEKEEMVNFFKKSDKREEIEKIKETISEINDKLENLKTYSGVESYIKFFYEETSSIIDYFQKDETIYFIDEPKRVKEKYEVASKEFQLSMMGRYEKGYLLPSQLELLHSFEDIINKLKDKTLIVLSTLTQSIKEINIKEHYNLEVKSINPYNNSFEMLIKDLKAYQDKKYKVALLAGSKTRAERLVKDLQERDIRASYNRDFSSEIIEGNIVVGYGNLHKGFEYPLIRYAIISETDVFSKKKEKKRKKQYKGNKIQKFTDLSVGNYVVHENHGLGIFQGIEKIEVEGISKDYIKISYRDNGNLYVSTNQLDLIQKYIGAEGRKPKLNKLGSSEWVKTKTKVRKAVEDLAKDLIGLYAKRQEEKGYVYSKDTLWQKEFEEMFPFEETEDQLYAIRDTKKDMESQKIMDRLICGDVGYGKTEVAIRAAFKAVQDGKQVAYLVPTTILAQQHYNNFVQRMKNFPIKVEMLSRFRSAKEQKQTTEGLRKGLVDIVIGTHRIISKDVVFKDLGLLIVDEEQRFGVKHKEKMKQMKEHVDVLTLTATPIPRTLHMSLIGIRDMSVLEEPPEERLPIQTYVLEYNEEMIREAIHRELAREGQVYYVYNRVKDIDEIADRISKMVPEAQVAFAHGQMNERELEQIMFDFINGEIDVLVSTTIIETGLDISNVNTIIIHDSDQMGLSQLYQLRGRVGRSNRVAYAYLCYKKNKMLNETAEKRLQAIREFTEFGSGFKIAMRDLEIRGAGNLLGSEQHGHMEAVGYDMYCKLLEQAIKTMKNHDQEDSFDTTIEMNVNAYIPQSYIENEIQKLDIYKRIAAIENEEDYFEIQEEIEDRYGDIPKTVSNLLEIALIKALAHSADIISVEQRQDYIKLQVRQETKINPIKIPGLIEKYNNKLKFSIKDAPFFTYKVDINNKNEFFRQIKNVLHDIKDLKD
ncbi:transcription-repair coupling factor [Natranaerovirga pectinivora]|uniref:Transcription-repair-coupling factor n=1 Tax=Natranaerovirga pectinivora TaxID=682400 RepID=A0A4R3MK42_9FIRM|nr:transcription-repair coupling factor [Natranaerovirga pectinivora]TCT13058.1 transcription-repair coupling factor [Natranaerovirga pectinivora]